MASETEPRPVNPRRRPERTPRSDDDLLARISLPYSDLHWWNYKKEADAFNYLRNNGRFPRKHYQDEDWYFKDEKGKWLPGNITEEIYWAVHHTLPFQRLSGIRQLSLLSYADIPEVNSHARMEGFTHTRDIHCFLTARMLELILRKNKFPKRSIGNGTITGMTHDLAIPALGEPTKEIDQEVLSEETALGKIFQIYDTTPLKRFGFSPKKSLAMVKGEGLEGELLDIADKISYTAVDVRWYLSMPYIYQPPGSDIPYMNLSLPDLYSETDEGPLKSIMEPIKAILRSDPEWANIYQEVSITSDGHPYFQDPRRLGVFLELRARMHQALYLNPHCRGLDYIYKMLVTPLYSRDPDPNHSLNSENLLIYTDDELFEIVNEKWQLDDELKPYHQVLDVLPDFQYVNVNFGRDIPSTVKKLEGDGKFVIGAETIRRFNPGCDFLTIDPSDNQIRPYKDVRPQHARYLERLSDFCNRTVVYYWPEHFPTGRRPHHSRIKTILEELKSREKRES